MTSYNPDRDYADGAVLERNWDDGPHSSMHGHLAATLANCEDAGEFTPYGVKAGTQIPLCVSFEAWLEELVEGERCTKGSTEGTPRGLKLLRFLWLHCQGESLGLHGSHGKGVWV